LAQSIVTVLTKSPFLGRERTQSQSLALRPFGEVPRDYEGDENQRARKKKKLAKLMLPLLFRCGSVDDPSALHPFWDHAIRRHRVRGHARGFND